MSDRPISAIAREILARWPQATVRSSWLLGVEVDLGDLRMRVVGDPDAFTWQASVTASAAPEAEPPENAAPCSATDPDPVRAAERALKQYDAGAAGKGESQ